MSDGVLSQEEINALLNGGISDATDDVVEEDELTPDEVDTIGEIANIREQRRPRCFRWSTKRWISPHRWSRWVFGTIS